MKILIVGPGAIGCLLAGYLTKSGQDVWLLDKPNQKRTKLIEAEGIKIEGVNGSHKIKVNITSDIKDIKKTELIIICVKSYDTEAAVKSIKSLISETTYCLTLQNGLGNVEAIAEIAGENNVIGGVTSHGATLVSGGHIKHCGKGETVIGRWQPQGKKQPKQWKIPRRVLEDIAGVLKGAGFTTKVSDKIKDVLWSKLIINVGINALAAITRLNNGLITEYAGTRQILKQSVLEASKIARRKKISLDYSDPVKKVESVCSQTEENISSMLQDILKNKKTEIDYINGAIVREGEDLGIPTPVNSVLTDLVKTIEASYNKQV
ncbi:MAG: 2-dehydropantoate 2-reductase [Candidatus Omnitrophica bacterium CG03_land_8_20_14_0_80_43_22]|nr:MAG: 2-dehydropantoate 2-reductase [Candidatus Omnitrophica bacterium CG03_land_8_20_14_0_80_43_22]